MDVFFIFKYSFYRFYRYRVKKEDPIALSRSVFFWTLNSLGYLVFFESIITAIFRIPKVHLTDKEMIFFGFGLLGLHYAILGNKSNLVRLSETYDNETESESRKRLIYIILYFAIGNIGNIIFLFLT